MKPRGGTKQEMKGGAAKQEGATRFVHWFGPSSPTTNINPADMVVVGDICDRKAVAAAVRGVRYVVHAAADYRLWTPSPAEILRTNVAGTRIVMQEALHAGVERIVYTSGVATIELAPERRPTKAVRWARIWPSAPTRRARSLPREWSRTW
jgi:nucleoside-diphosphate-sugar epimerase